MKMRLARTAPLPTQAVRLFRELHLLTGWGELCFQGRQPASRRISGMALLNGVRRMGFGKEEMTIHGFHAMFAPILNEKKLERALTALPSGTAYNQASCPDKRREMLQKRAACLDELRSQSVNKN